MIVSDCKTNINHHLSHLPIRGRYYGYDKYYACNFNYFTVSGTYTYSINFFSDFGIYQTN